MAEAGVVPPGGLHGMGEVSGQVGRGRVERPLWRSAWHGWINALIVAWLMAAAGAGGAGAVGLDAVPAWLGVHALLLGAATTAIVVWSEHFAAAVLHAGPPGGRWSTVRLAVLSAGQIAVLVGVVVGSVWLAGVGATLVAAAIAGHGLALWRLRGRAMGGPLRGIVDFYLAASGALVAGAVAGGLMGSGLAGGEPWHSRLRLAHVHLNLGGWVFLTILGTLFMLLPAVLGTSVAPRSRQAMRWCLGLAAPGLAVAVTGMLVASRVVVVAGLATYAAGTGVAVVVFAATLRRKRPAAGSAWLVTAATVWLVVAVLADMLIVAGSPAGWDVSSIGPVLLVGVVAQVLMGSLTFLLPVVLGGGPSAVSAARSRLDRWWPVRFILLNAAVAALMVSGAVEQTGHHGPATHASSAGSGVLWRWGLTAAVLAGADFLVRATAVLASRLPWRVCAAGNGRRRAVVAGAAGGVLVTVVALLVAVSGGGQPAGEHAHGESRVVEVELAGMRVSPASVTVPAGTNLTLRVSNRDPQPHDLRSSTGARTALLRQGDSDLLHLGPVTGEVTAWCTVAGHHAAGMTLSVSVSSQPSTSEHAGFSPGFQPYDATVPAADGQRIHRVDLDVVETELEVAPGVRRNRWTFGGSVPGPVLRGSVGDVFEVTLTNSGSLGHGIDFHAGALAPDGPMRTIQPGERLVYRFRAEQAGVWMYHCSTPPMTQHIGGGMFGAVIIDPPDLGPVDREYLLVASEIYPGDAGSDTQAAKLTAGAPDHWAFNGTAGQYDRFPLTARAGQRVRFWVLNAGPGGAVSFHLVGAVFDTVFHEGGYRLRPGEPGGAQSLGLHTAQGGFVETVFPQPGHYPIVDHDMRHAEGGAHGLVTVPE